MVYEKKNMDFDQYKINQGRKINAKRQKFVDSIPSRRKKFLKIFEQEKMRRYLQGKVICLGARTGCEVWALRQLKRDVIGIDLHPARPGDGLVLTQDWHDIQFPDNAFDSAFTNAIDHCYDLAIMLSEVRRVLKTGGTFVVMISKKQFLASKEDKEEYISKSLNFLFWENGDDLAENFRPGFSLLEKWDEDNKWEALAFRNEG
jgi:SAM-dependent methyltransferase